MMSPKHLTQVRCLPILPWKVLSMATSGLENRRFLDWDGVRLLHFPLCPSEWNAYLARLKRAVLLVRVQPWVLCSSSTDGRAMGFGVCQSKTGLKVPSPCPKYTGKRHRLKAKKGDSRYQARPATFTCSCSSMDEQWPSKPWMQVQVLSGVLNNIAM